MWAASSYPAIRASRSVSPGRSSRCLRFSDFRYSRYCSCGTPRSSGGGSRFRIRGSRGLTTVPWKSEGSQPFSQFLTPSTGTPPGSVSTTNAGRSRDSEPRPYVIQLPSAGRPATALPVVSASMDWPWLFTPVFIDRMSAISSAIPPMWGSRSEISVPHLPRFSNFHGLAIRTELASAALSNLISPPNVVPSCLASSFFGSKRSRWLGPPCMNIEIIAFARGAACDGFGERSYFGRSKSGLSWASRPSSRSSVASATAPSPIAFVARKWRREGQPQSSVDIQELIRADQRLAEAGQTGVLLVRRHPVQERHAVLHLLVRRRAREGELPRDRNPRGRIVARLAPHALRELLRPRENERVVHQEQRLGSDRRERSRLAVGLHDRHVEALQHREDPAPAHLDVEAPAELVAVERKDLVDLALAVEVLLAHDDLSHLVRHHGHRRAEHFEVEVARDRQHRVADRFGLQAVDVHAPEQPVLRVRRLALGLAPRGLAVGGRHQDHLVDRFEPPALAHELVGQPV